MWSQPTGLLLLLLYAYGVACANWLTIDLVLSHYDEPLVQVVAFVQKAEAALPQCRLRVLLYCQGPTVDLPASTVFPRSWIVTHLPNINREAHAYLSYLRSNFNASSDFVWFTQALPNGNKPHSLYLWSRLRYLSPSTGMLALCGVGSYSCGQWNYGARIVEMFALTQHRLCRDDDRWAVFFNGEFIVSRARIRAHPSWLYEALWNTSETENAYRQLDEHAVLTLDEPPLTNYTFAFVMERCWNLLFSCTAPSWNPRKHVQDLRHRQRRFQCFDA